MHVTIPYSSGTVETVVTQDGEFDLLVPLYPSSGEITNPGEIAISTLDGYEAICIKSDKNENVLFSYDAANQTKLSSWYNSANGGLSLAQNNDNGPVLSLSEGVPLNNQTIITYRKDEYMTLYVFGYEQVAVDGHSLTPFKDSESCAVYKFTDNLPDNLNEMKDIKFNVKSDKHATKTFELTIDNGTDIRKLQNQSYNAFFCDCIHGLENVESADILIPGSGRTPAYPIKQLVVSDITASFADSSQTGCHAVASHAEGSNSTTFAVGSHAEGHNNNNSDDPYTSGLTTGKFSHCEGTQNQALAPASSVHNAQTYAHSAATGSSVYGFKTSVSNEGEFACGEEKENNIVATAGRLFSVGDGICIDNTPIMFQAAQQCTPHSVFKILKGDDENNPYYYPLFDLSSASVNITRDLVIKATVTVNNEPTTLTKTLGEWYEFIINGGNN